MMQKAMMIPTGNELLNILMSLLALPGPSGEESQVVDWIRQYLHRIGVPPSRIRQDRVHREIPGFREGNLIVKFPGAKGLDRLLFSAHMDTVPLCKGAVPIFHGDRILPKGTTALGADNRTGVAVLLGLASYLLKNGLRSPPVTLLFSVGEEVGLRGASGVSLASLGNPKMGFNFDGGSPNRIVIGAIGSDRMHITVRGRAAHAGMHPEQGISAGVIAAEALALLNDGGWHGRISKGCQSGTANVGVLSGGTATNQVMDTMILKAETRSHSLAFLNRMTKTWESAFHKAARRASIPGHSACVDFEVCRQYLPFRLKKSDPVVLRSLKAAQSLGLLPETAVINGGLDANALHAKGLPVVTLGAGQHGAHTLQEYVDVPEFLKGCELAFELCR